MIKVALTGKLRSGKDTVADMFLKHGFSGYKLSMGITEIINNYFPNDVQDGCKLREHYTTIGQGLRKLDDKVWLNRTWKEIQRNDTLFGIENVIITDLRQKNEEEFLRDKGFIIVKVESTMETRLRRATEADGDFDVTQMFHETEVSVETIDEDYAIENEGSLSDLKETVEELIDIILKKEMSN